MHSTEIRTAGDLQKEETDVSALAESQTALNARRSAEKTRPPTQKAREGERQRKDERGLSIQS